MSLFVFKTFTKSQLGAPVKKLVSNDNVFRWNWTSQWILRNIAYLENSAYLEFFSGFCYFELTRYYSIWHTYFLQITKVARSSRYSSSNVKAEIETDHAERDHSATSDWNCPSQGSDEIWMKDQRGRMFSWKAASHLTCAHAAPYFHA